MIPTNEQGVVAYFLMNIRETEWELVSIRQGFPDAILRYRGVDWRVEFEFMARNFELHGHDPHFCDLIICWENNFPDSPVPVLSLSAPRWKETEVVRGNKYLAQIDYWKARALRAEAAPVVPALTEKVDALPALHLAVAEHLIRNEPVSLNEVSRLSVALGGRSVGRKQAREILAAALRNAKANREKLSIQDGIE